MSNDNPENARLAQDVAAPEHHSREPRPEQNFHVGRGGAANVAKLGESETIVPKSMGAERRKSEAAADRDAMIRSAKAKEGNGNGNGNGNGGKKGPVERGMDMIGSALQRVKTNEGKK